MRFPNKITRYSDSVINKFVCILKIVSKERLSLYQLYCETRNKFPNIIDFIEALDCLFALNSISLVKKEGGNYYVVRNIL